MANGHIDDTVRNIAGHVGHAQPPQLFLNQRNGTFRQAIAEPLSGAGIASALLGERVLALRLKRRSWGNCQ